MSNGLADSFLSTSVPTGQETRKMPQSVPRTYFSRQFMLYIKSVFSDVGTELQRLSCCYLQQKRCTVYVIAILDRIILSNIAVSLIINKESRMNKMENIEHDTSAHSKIDRCELYVVSPKKFTILFLCTLGLYGVYWSYKNWSLYKSSSNENVWPVARALFDIFFIHSLCNKILPTTEPVSDSKERANIEWYATKYVILAIFGRVCDQLSNKDIGMPYSYFVSTLLLPLTFQALYAIQLKINQHMGDESGCSNETLTWANYAWIVVGVLLWLLVLIGSVAVLFGF